MDDKKFKENMLCLAETIIRHQRHNFTTFLPIIMEPLMKLLDEAESLTELLACLNPISSLAEHHEAHFLTIFEDTADLIIGWLVDPTGNLDQYRELTDIMIEFHAFWLNNLADSAQYFENFLKDINDYTQDAKKQYEEFEASDLSEIDDTPLQGLIISRVFQARKWKIEKG